MFLIMSFQCKYWISRIK